MERVTVPPELIRWARQRAGLSLDELAARLPKFPEWETGAASPTLRQLEELAQRSHLWLGFFFLPWAPAGELEIADYRAQQDRLEPSMNLLEMVHLCRLRQQWYREQALLRRMKPLKFIGSKRPEDPVVEVAQAIRATVNFPSRDCSNPKDAAQALEAMIDEVEAAGILVMRGGSVPVAIVPGTENPEFRGMVLSDSHAPLIYLDASDTVASQIFTLVHELAHLWLGASGISNPRETLVADVRAMESFCNRVAAEALVPLSAFRDAWDRHAPLASECARLASAFCISDLIILRRAYDANFIDGETFHAAYQRAVQSADRVAHITGVAGKPLTPLQRVGKRFADALAAAVQTHKMDEHEAMALLGASMPEEVWCVCGSHDHCIEAEPEGAAAPAYTHLAVPPVPAVARQPTAASPAAAVARRPRRRSRAAHRPAARPS
ncbi:MAG TPA: XRE family transcriptional regulator [Prosthecobacter sp.]|nr:XRE family transcriptional regulator [Prosthecobacter sp.]